MDLELILEMAAQCLAVKVVLSEENPDGYDKAILGLTDNGELVYSKEIMLEAFMKERKDLSEEESWELLDLNCFSAYIGDQTPIFINTY